MNIYVETNFILELVFEQSEATNCEEILTIGEGGNARLIVPAFSFAEPQWTLTQQEKV